MAEQNDQIIIQAYNSYIFTIYMYTQYLIIITSRKKIYIFKKLYTSEILSTIPLQFLLNALLKFVYIRFLA